jgi:hypothetical protein
VPISIEAGILDEHLQKLIKELGEAINDAVQESEEVNQALERIRAAGHEILLVLEATIAFKDKRPDQEDDPLPFKEISIEERLADISHEDRQFLKSLNIRFDNDDQDDNDKQE